MLIFGVIGLLILILSLVLIIRVRKENENIYNSFSKETREELEKLENSENYAKSQITCLKKTKEKAARIINVEYIENSYKEAVEKWKSEIFSINYKKKEIIEKACISLILECSPRDKNSDILNYTRKNV
jgi:hypothetical protein